MWIQECNLEAEIDIATASPITQCSIQIVQMDYITKRMTLSRNPLTQASSSSRLSSFWIVNHLDAQTHHGRHLSTRHLHPRAVHLLPRLLPLRLPCRPSWPRTKQRLPMAPPFHSHSHRGLVLRPGNYKQLLQRLGHCLCNLQFHRYLSTDARLHRSSFSGVGSAELYSPGSFH